MRQELARKIKRWSRLDRALHWSIAFTFLTLAFSGFFDVGLRLVNLFKAVHSTFGALSFTMAKQYHNYIRPDFLCAVDGCSYQVVAQVNLPRWSISGGSLKLEWYGRETRFSSHLQSFRTQVKSAILACLSLWASLRSVAWCWISQSFGQTRRDMELSNLDSHACCSWSYHCGLCSTSILACSVWKAR